MGDGEKDSNGGSDPLIDPSLLKGLSEEERREALAAAEAARRAEERAERRAMERALKRKEEERQRERERERMIEEERRKRSGPNGLAPTSGANDGSAKIVFVSKRKRADGNQSNGEAQPQPSDSSNPSGEHSKRHTDDGRLNKKGKTTEAQGRAALKDSTDSNNDRPQLSEREMTYVRQTYLGKTGVEAPEESKDKKKRSTKKMTFKFRWDNTDDTLNDDDPLYASMLPAAKKHANNGTKKRTKRRTLNDEMMSDVATVETAQTKPLERMTARDWRIFRENYEISVKGGKAPPPMRSFRESPAPELPQLHPALLDALEKEMGFKEPTPIQRQAIPIGLQRRDLIGVAETGSGKTVAFGVPLCHYLLNLPREALNSVAQNGPLALVMAPTRELALQIEVELSKLLSRQRHIKACAIVGGQPIQQQAQVLRKGVHIVVGTPGRINDCIDMAYMVLNQCSYIVLDEADRMIE